MRLSFLVVASFVLSSAGCTEDAGPDRSSAGSGGSLGGSGGASGGTSSGGTGGTSGTNGTVGGSSGIGSGGAGTGGASGAGASGGSAGTGGAGGAAGQTSSGGTSGQAGAGGSSAGSSGDAGSAGTAGTAGSSGDPCDTAIFCDDFESYTLGSPPNGMWTAVEDDGTVAVDSEQKVSGNQSVKFTTQATSSGRGALIRLMDPSVFPVTGNAYYGRMMYRLESAPTEAVHWTILAGGGVVPNATHHALYRYGGQHPVMDGQNFVGSQLMANYETPDWYSNMNTPGSDCWQHANGDVLPTGAFVCVEWFFDGPNDEMRLWLDGTPIDSVTVTGSGQGCVNAANDFTWSAPEFETLDLGWEAYQPDDERTAFIDDVVISTTKVGCP